MIAKIIKGWNVIFKGNGDDVYDLKIRREVLNDRYRALSCAWEPTPKELELLNNGGLIVVSLLTINLPPMHISVEAPDE